MVTKKEIEELRKLVKDRKEKEKLQREAKELKEELDKDKISTKTRKIIKNIWNKI